MPSWLAEFIGTHLYLIIACLCQGVIIFLPVSFCNWHDDMIWILTYTALQGFNTALLFVFTPTYLEIDIITNKFSEVIVVGMYLVAWFKVLKNVPLEFRNIIKKEPPKEILVVFSDFYQGERLNIMASYDVSKLSEKRGKLKNFKEKISQKMQSFDEGIY